MSVIRSFLLMLAPCVTLIIGAIGKSESVSAGSARELGPTRRAQSRGECQVDRQRGRKLSDTRC